jgi:lipopolysaccharide heptosyltransferase II
MPRETVLTHTLARLARFPFWALARRPWVEPRKVLILKPCCVSQVMLATPLLAALNKKYPQARFDWATSDWARPAVAGNPRIDQLISTGEGSLNQVGWGAIRQLVLRLRQERYDTCFVPARSALLSLITWWAQIPQRVGLRAGGRGFAYTRAARPPAGTRHEAAVYLSLLPAVGKDSPGEPLPDMEFYPADMDRAAVTRRLVDELDWMGEVPLAIIHPGGGHNPVLSELQKQWPAERFVLLANQLVREHQARILLIGDGQDKALANDIAGLMSVPAANWAGVLSLGEVGALAEVADLYVGNDAGPTHIAAAMGCPTLAIFGPSDPAVSGPYSANGRVMTLWRASDKGQAFSWEQGITVAEAAEAAGTLLAEKA